MHTASFIAAGRVAAIVLARRLAEVAQLLKGTAAGCLQSLPVVWGEEIRQCLIKRATDRQKRRPDSSVIDDTSKRASRLHSIESVGEDQAL